MLGRLIRSKPIQLVFIIGLSIYMVVTVIGLLIKHTDKWVPTEQKRSVEKGKDPSNWNPKQDRTEQREKLDTILQLLRHINPDYAGNNSQMGADNTANTQQRVNRTSHVIQNRNVLESGSKRIPVDLNKVLQVPKQKPPMPGKVSLSEVEYMPEPHYPPSTCPKTLSSITKYSKWFREHYLSGVKIFLDEDDINTFDNFHKLSHYSLPFGYKRENRTLLGEIVNHINFTNEHLRRDKGQCIRCAVVGCGGILNGSNAGEEIDSHDYVFRLNRALASGHYAQDVGIKTSFYTFFPESMHIKEVQDSNAVHLFAAFKKYDLDYALRIIQGNPPPPFVSKGKTYKIATPGIDPGKFKVIHPDFFRYVFTHYLETKGHRPTTGALVVLLSVHLCDEVAIYGFGYDSRFTLHYYDKKFVAHTNKSTALHDVDNERELWNKLHEEGVIRLFKRDL